MDSDAAKAVEFERHQQALAAFATRLDEYASALSVREQRLLEVIIFRAMSPLERARAQGETGLLTPDEERLLRELDESDIGT
jgi:hypothetical protein